MLAALLLLGILPFAALPLMQEDAVDADDDGTSPTVPASGTGEAGDMLDEGDPGVLEPTDPADPDPGETHSLIAEPGETVFTDFEPGEDLVEFDLSAAEGPVLFDAGVTADGATVSFSIGPDSVSTLTFEGLTEVPAPGEQGFAELLAAERYAGPETGPYRMPRDARGQPRWPRSVPRFTS